MDFVNICVVGKDRNMVPWEAVDTLAAMGHKTGRGTFGAQCTIVVDPSTNVLNAGPDPRCDAGAFEE
ncbi:MAG: hypothetical protein GX318_07105 [Clostridia bacterium]|nr:hypothetical protein [Clostridia bacterium]